MTSDGQFLMNEPPLAARALRLFTISATTPIATFLVVAMVTVLHFRARPGTSDVPVFISVFSTIVAVIMVWSMYWSFRYKPEYWSTMTTFDGFFIALFTLMTVFGAPADQRFGLNTPTYSVLGSLLILGILILSWLPARRGSRMVLDNFSSDVVNSLFVIRFRSRVDRDDVLCVTPDSLDIVLTNSTYKAERSYPLTDVSAVAVRAETNEGKYPVPNLADRTITVKPGDVVVVHLPDGELVFPAQDVRRLKRFIEDRRAAVLAE